VPKELVTKKGDRLSFRDQTWVAWEDYAALRSALREALDGWWECRGDLEQTGQERAIKRITELRKQFLED
jgi:hypothetical protein